MSKETEQFYCNYEFSDQKVNDNGGLTEDRIIELLEAFHKEKSKDIKELIEFLNSEVEGKIYTRELLPSFLAGLKIHLAIINQE